MSPLFQYVPHPHMERRKAAGPPKVLQLVLLPIIIVGQNVQAAAADARAQATYDDAAAVLEEAKQIQAHPEAQDAAIEKITGLLSASKTG